MQTEHASSELKQAEEMLSRVLAMLNAPYWNSDRREKVTLCVQKVQGHLQTVKECLTAESSTSTKATLSGS